MIYTRRVKNANSLLFRQRSRQRPSPPPPPPPAAAAAAAAAAAENLTPPRSMRAIRHIT